MYQMKQRNYVLVQGYMYRRSFYLIYAYIYPIELPPFKLYIQLNTVHSACSGHCIHIYVNNSKKQLINSNPYI